MVIWDFFKVVLVARGKKQARTQNHVLERMQQKCKGIVFMPSI